MPKKAPGSSREGQRLPRREYVHGQPVPNRSRPRPADTKVSGPQELTPRRARPIRTERERSGVARSGYVPVSRTWESNVRRKLRGRT